MVPPDEEWKEAVPLQWTRILDRPSMRLLPARCIRTSKEGRRRPLKRALGIPGGIGKGSRVDT